MYKLKLILFILALGVFSVFEAKSQKKALNINYFSNPIFAGDYPDPSILVDGKDYYIVHSSFEYYPGLLIWHSTDLIHWKPIVNALTKYMGSVWAPELIKYDEKYFIYFPVSGTNYVIVADDIAGPWSDPIELKVPMIDPGHVVDAEGNRYLYFSSGSYVPLSKDGLSIAGEVQHSYNGWEIPREWAIECFCMEGPKLFKRGDYYYLTVAEGGTAGPPTGHMVISARSKSPLGPWENSPYNPIIRTQTTQEQWCSVGHSTVFEDAEGDWWMIFHGYEKEHYNMGRQTLMLPVEWINEGWYKIPEDVSLKKSFERKKVKHASRTSSFEDNFEGGFLKPNWSFFREFDSTRFQLNKNSITIDGKGNSLSESSPLLYIPTDHSYTTQVEVETEGDAIGGLVLFYNEEASSGILVNDKNILTNIRGWQFETERNVINNHAFLRLVNKNNIVDMFYSTNGKDWLKIENSLDVSGFHHNVLGGFLSLRIGLSSFGGGKVVFKNFIYEPLE